MEVFSIAKGFYHLLKNVPTKLNQKEFDRLRALKIHLTNHWYYINVQK